MTIKAVAELHPDLMQLLTEIRDRLPAPAPASTEAADTDEQYGRPESTMSNWQGAPRPEASGARGVRKIAQSQALYAMLCNLDSWIRGARENHGAMEHRNENTGEECWRQFAPSDIRSMINDTARELGISAFPRPVVPEEDNPRF
jgi:hypothetical protein